MRVTLLIHVLAGGLGLLSGYVALYAAKGAQIAFFLGQGRVPEAIRTPALIATGVSAPMVIMSFWLWRLRRKQSFLGIVNVKAPEAI